MSPDKREFMNKIRQGRAIADARAQGVELIDEERLQDLLHDLHTEGFLELADRYDSGEVAVRGMEILRG